MLVDSELYIKIDAAYEAWLAENGRTRSRESGGIFSAVKTHMGTDRFHGLSKAQLNEIVDGDKRYTD